ncbi:Smr-domain-containing protein [Wilcoxina mikolae CBS 423.85]|nr:Smr-domain-containing protein [Wilcoxina mikolae CBS 423.85]
MGQLVSTPTPSPSGQDLRNLAFESDALRRAYSEQSQAAWRAGRKDDAKALSDLSKQAGAEQTRLHALAAEKIFATNNPTNPSLAPRKQRSFFSGWFSGGGDEAGGLKKVDLHGLLVAEALARVEQHVASCREHGVLRTLIITGRGLHSQGGVARVRPEVEAWLRERSSKVRVLQGRNEGAFDVELVEQKGWTGRFWNMLGW